MAWEERNGTRYYYRKRRIGRRVVSEYVGAGYLAELHANQDRAEQRRTNERRQALRDLEAEARAIDAQLEQLEQYAGTLVKAVALASGYHPHKGQWRKVKHAS